eukprot:CFRG5826T1
MATSQIDVRGKHTKVSLVELTVVPYDIASWSSYSANFHPENIMENQPTNQASRWSTGSNNRQQFICVKLQKDTIVHSITFGKYCKIHICNMKEFKVYGGMTEEGMIEILHSGLNNDDQLEQFPVLHMIDGLPFVCRYIKIVPLQSFGESFNYSIWYMQLKGISEPNYVANARKNTDEHLEREALKLCLKHLRQRNHIQAFDALQAMTNVALEHPVLSQLHKLLVVNADYNASEALLKEMCQENVFEHYIKNMGYSPEWKHIVPVDANGSPTDSRPGRRGGHVMVMDADKGRIYLMGGWNGKRDYSDLWVFEINTQRWVLLSDDTKQDGGPGPRACHKACFDPVNRCIYLLGRYIEVEGRTRPNLQSDFYRYDVDAKKWTLLSIDTAADGGPNLLFDHQLNMDSHTQTVICYGGQLLAHGVSQDYEYSDLFFYHVNANVWETFDLSGAHSTILKSSNVNSNNMYDDAKEDSTGDTTVPIAPYLSLAAGARGAGGGTSMHTNTHASTSTSRASANLDLDRTRSTSSSTTGSANVDDTESAINIKPRMGHSMVLDTAQRQLYIFHGKRLKQNLSDFYVYDLDTARIVDVVRDSSKIGGPDANFTQRATIDSERRELYVLTGLMKDKKSSEQKVRSSFWVFSLDDRQWRRVYENDHDDQAYWQTMRNIEPCPRFAHQLVYNPITKVHYMFGGNPGSNSNSRLDDFWSLQLHQKSPREVLSKALFMIRSQHFLDLCRKDDKIEALAYLQTELAEVVNHDDKAQSDQFRALTSFLFQTSTTTPSMPSQSQLQMNEFLTSTSYQTNSSSAYSGSSAPLLSSHLSSADSVGYTERAALYERLQMFFPPSMKQPSANLIELLLTLKNK